MLYQPKDMLSVVYLYYNEDDGVNKIFKIDYENNRTNEIELIFKDDQFDETISKILYLFLYLIGLFDNPKI